MLDVKGCARVMYWNGTPINSASNGIRNVAVQRRAGMFTKPGPRRDARSDEPDLISIRRPGHTSRNRKKQPEEVKRLLDDGPFLGKSALEGGLVDALAFEDEMLGKLREQLKLPEIKKISENDYATITPGSVGIEGPARIAFVTGDGEIVRAALRTKPACDAILRLGVGPFADKLDRRVDCGVCAQRFAGGDGMHPTIFCTGPKTLSKKKPWDLEWIWRRRADTSRQTATPCWHIESLTGSIGGSTSVNFSGCTTRSAKKVLTRGGAPTDSDYDAESNRAGQAAKRNRGILSRILERRRRRTKRPYAERTRWRKASVGGR